MEVLITDHAGRASDSALAALREQLGELQLPQIAFRRRAIILLEGPDGAGKKTALRHLAAAFDPCHFTVHSTEYDRREANDGHWLARFWRQLPRAGETAIFYRSWYRRVLDDRLLGRTPAQAVPRIFDEINEFEAQQRDYGTLLVKLYFQVPASVQEQRLADRASCPWSGERKDAVRVSDPAYQRALEELKVHSDTRWSPWRMIDGSDEGTGSLDALEAVADAWSKAMPVEPPKLIVPARA